MQATVQVTMKGPLLQSRFCPTVPRTPPLQWGCTRPQTQTHASHVFAAQSPSVKNIVSFGSWDWTATTGRGGRSGSSSRIGYSSSCRELIHREPTVVAAAAAAAVTRAAAGARTEAAAGAGAGGPRSVGWGDRGESRKGEERQQQQQQRWQRPPGRYEESRGSRSSREGRDGMSVRERWGGGADWDRYAKEGYERGTREGYESGMRERGQVRGGREGGAREGRGDGRETTTERFLPDKISSERAYAVVSLMRVEQGGAYADLIFGTSLSSYQHDDRCTHSSPSSSDPDLGLAGFVVEEEGGEGERGSGGRRRTSAAAAAANTSAGAAAAAAAAAELAQYVERTLGFHPGHLDSRGKRKVTVLVAGATRWRRYLDYVLAHAWTGTASFDRIEPILKQILRVGALEIIKMDTPNRAAVYEAVGLASACLRPGAGAVVNAVLRRLSQWQESDTLPTPSTPDTAQQTQGVGEKGSTGLGDRDVSRSLATVHSHPVWMVRRWLSRYGFEPTMQLLQHNNRWPTFGVRVNTLAGVSVDDVMERLHSIGVECERSEHLDSFIRIGRGMQAVLEAGLIRSGECNVQDESAGLVVHVLDPQPGESIVDCCAAPGGKTLLAAAMMGGRGKIDAVDVNDGRVRMVAQAAQRQGVGGMVHCHAADLTKWVERSPTMWEKVDRVLLDAPCSGLGVLSKRPDLRWRRTAEGEAELTLLQDQLLDAAARLVRRNGGVLVYSTCSIEPAENEERILSFLARHEDFEVEVQANSAVPREMITADGFFASLPQRDGIDGAFAAKLRRK